MPEADAEAEAVHLGPAYEPEAVAQVAPEPAPQGAEAVERQAAPK